MTKLLQEMIEKLDRLPEEEQDRYVSQFLAELTRSNEQLDGKPDFALSIVAGKRPGYGCLKGLITVPNDFDAPLDDFKDYM